MANQNVIIHVSGRRTGRRSIRAVAVDSNGSLWTFTDFNAAGGWTTDDRYTIEGISGQGTTAPVVTAGQVRVSGNDRAFFINLAATFDPKASMSDRLGSLQGVAIEQGATLAIVSRT